jgi:hypothetical protein
MKIYSKQFRVNLFLLITVLLFSSLNLSVYASVSGPYIFEAENMGFTHSTTETVTYLNYANNNQPLETITLVRGNIGQTSTATVTFTGAPGNNDILTRFVGKVENGASYTLSVNAVARDQWNSGTRYGTDYKDPKNIDIHTSSQIALNTNDTISLTFVSNTEVAYVDKLIVQAYQGPPSSTLTLDSPNTTLNDGFTWARNRALGRVFYPGNPSLGHEGEWWRLSDSTHTTLTPGYWGAYNDRESFYNRDISHQTDGAHLLGLDNENLNMLKLFAGSAALPGQNYWPLWAFSSYGLMYYIDQTGFRELPSPFDIMQKCYKQYLWTGNSDWINDPSLNAYYNTTTGQFLTDHNVVWNDLNPLNEQPVVQKKSNNSEFSATYWEDSNDLLIRAGDSVGCEYQALLAYAGILKAKGDTSGETLWRNRAQRLKDYFEANWYDSSTGRYIRGFTSSGSFKSNWGHENSFFIPLEGLGDYGSRTDNYLSFIDANDDNLGIEATTYLPEVYYKYNKSSSGWNWLSKILTDKNSYPEVSFTAISNIIEGMMGVQPDAPNNKVATVSRLTNDVPWVEVNHVKVGGNDLKIRHDGLTSTTLTNNSGGTLTWEAQFYGTPSTIYVNGVEQTVQTKSLFGKNISYVTVAVSSGTQITASTLPLNGTYKLVNRLSGKVLDVPNAETSDGTQLIQWSYNGGNNQKWNITSNGDGTYKIKSVNSGKCVDVQGAASFDLTPIIQWTDSGSSNQKWQLIDVGNGYYEILSQATGKAIAVENAVTTDGAKIVQWTYMGSQNDQWRIIAP